MSSGVIVLTSHDHSALIGEASTMSHGVCIELTLIFKAIYFVVVIFNRDELLY